jgi:hypothetical protein
MKSRQIVDLITFAGGDEKYFDGQRRLVKQAYKLNFFHNIIEYRLQDLNSDFFELFGNIFSENPKKIGCCAWKPWIIHEHLSKMKQGQILLYLDNGFEINIKARQKIDGYIDKINEKKILVFSTGLKHVDYTKPDQRLVDFGNVDAMQVSAAFIAIEKCEYSSQIVKKWLELSSFNKGEFLYPTINNSSGEVFDNHRYDQSILTRVLHDQDYIAEYPDPTYNKNWVILQDSPFINFRNFSDSSVLFLELTTGLVGSLIRITRFILRKTGLRKLLNLF